MRKGRVMGRTDAAMAVSCRLITTVFACWTRPSVSYTKLPLCFTSYIPLRGLRSNTPYAPSIYNPTAIPIHNAISCGSFPVIASTSQFDHS
eukprot:54858-Eustigmatos_ZCMA.PRE.1